MADDTKEPEEHPDGDERFRVAMGWEPFNVTKGGKVVAAHIVPSEEFVHRVDQDGNCTCGPSQVDYETPAGEVPHYRHWPLDARYYGSV